jgi:hypothetical protein
MAKGSLALLRHGVLLVYGAPCQLPSLAGHEHGQTIPLPEVKCAAQQTKMIV